MSNCLYINGSIPPQGSKVMTKSIMRTVRGKSALFALLQSDADCNADYEVGSYRLAGLLKDHQHKLTDIPIENQNMAIDDFLIDANGEMSSFASANSLSDYTAAASILTVNNGVATVSNIGDVSCYHYRHGNFSKIADVPARQAVYAGAGDETPCIPSVGGVLSGETPEHSFSEQIEIERDDIFLLCSSGVTQFVPEEKIAHIISQNLTDERSVQRIISEAIAMASDKDITVILIRNGGKPIRSKKITKNIALIISAVILLAVIAAFLSSAIKNLFKKPDITEDPSNVSVTSSPPDSEFIRKEDPANPIPPEPYTPPEEPEETEEESTEETENTDQTGNSDQAEEESAGNTAE